MAVETVLGADLPTVLVDRLPVASICPVYSGGDLRLLGPASDGVRVARAALDKVDAQNRSVADNRQVKPVDSLRRWLLRELSAGESLISRDGYWVGRHFYAYDVPAKRESGMLSPV